MLLSAVEYIRIYSTPQQTITRPGASRCPSTYATTMHRMHESEMFGSIPDGPLRPVHTTLGIRAAAPLSSST